MSISFLFAKAQKRLDLVDIAWGIGFVLVAWVIELRNPSSRSLLLTALVSVWGIRLALHIRDRSKTRGEDRRYKELSKKWRGPFWLRAYFSIFMLQGFLILLICMPILITPNPKLQGWSILSYFGALIWVIGFIIESIADRQLGSYMKSKEKPTLLDSGLWKYSRHPNYFGELIQWWAIGIIALQVSYGWVGLFGPLVLTILILFISGIPPIERHRSKNEDYKQYMKRTSKLILLPVRR